MTELEPQIKLHAALCKAQSELRAAKFNKINPHFKNKYADLAAVIDAIRVPFANNGLSVTQTTMLSVHGLILLTTLRHAEGGTIVSEYPLPASATPQQLGSALTYARRYSLSCMACIAADEDDDAEIAMDTKKTLPKKDAKEIYTKLQSDIRSAVSREGLKAWGVANKDRIDTMPEDWCDILRLQYEEMMADLRERETA